MFNFEKFRTLKFGKEKKGPAYEAQDIVVSSDFFFLLKLIIQ